MIWRATVHVSRHSRLFSWQSCSVSLYYSTPCIAMQALSNAGTLAYEQPPMQRFVTESVVLQWVHDASFLNFLSCELRPSRLSLSE